MNLTRESIFAGALRSFCTALAAALGILVGVFLIGMIISSVSRPTFLPPKPDLFIAPDAQGNRQLLSGKAPAILKLSINGVIGMGDLTGDKIENLLIESREDLLRGDRVKAVFLHLNTPGGTVSDADAIYRALMNYKAKYNVPIYAFVDGLCASGGMYIASAADKIFATPSSVIGSVGVIMGPSFNFSEAMSKLGVASLTLTEGKDKDALNPFRPWVPGEDASLKAVIASLYDRFVTIVTTSRKNLSKAKLINDYGAQVFVANTAQEYGYIDVANSSYEQALSSLVEMAGIGAAPYQVVQLVVAHSFLSELTQSSLLSGGKVRHTLELSPTINSELSGKLLYLYQP